MARKRTQKQSSGYTILVIDDQEEVLSSTRSVLKRDGHPAGQTLLTLFNDLLDFSKIEASKLELEHTDFDLRELVEDVTALFTEPAQKKGVKLVSAINADVPTALRGTHTDCAKFSAICSAMP